MLEKLKKRLQGKKTIILGIGNPMRGDDGAGPALIERLQGKVSATLIDAGEVPENYLGPIESAAPEVVLIVDAADLKASPGDVALIELDQLAQTGISTHNASLGLFASVVQRLTGADILVLAVQPEVNSFGAGISEEVERTLEWVEGALEEIFTFPPAQDQR
jgi:hydrogenase 3 maturation protease